MLKRSRYEKRTKRMFRSLHRDEFNRHGNINVTSLVKDISLRRIAGLKRDALMMSLSGAKLGTLTEGGFRPCQAHPTQYQLHGSHHKNPSEVAQDCAQTDDDGWRSQKPQPMEILLELKALALTHRNTSFQSYPPFPCTHSTAASACLEPWEIIVYLT